MKRKRKALEVRPEFIRRLKRIEKEKTIKVGTIRQAREYFEKMRR